MTFEQVFRVTKPVIGMIHLAGSSSEEKLRRAQREIGLMYDAGVSAVLVENYFGNTVDVAHVLSFLQKEYPDAVYGVNVLGDYEYGFKLARQYGAAFVQVDSICGHLSPKDDEAYRAEIAALRSQGTPVFLMGGVRFKYQPIRSGRSLEEDLKLGTERCDAIVVTGEGTGINTDMKKIKAFRAIQGDFPLIVGAGMTAETCQEQLSLADGAIVGSYFKHDGVTEREVDPERVKRLMAQVKALRGA